jgi:hypothetical protein
MTYDVRGFFQSYVFNMSCLDTNDVNYASEDLEFHTQNPSYQRRIDKLSADYLNEMNLKLLPAISSSVQQHSYYSGNSKNQLQLSTSRSRNNANKISPHAVLGK